MGNMDKYNDVDNLLKNEKKKKNYWTEGQKDS